MKRLILALWLAVLLAGCAPAMVRLPAPDPGFADATVPEFPPTIRTWGDRTPENVVKYAAQKAAQIRARGAAARSWELLAISGGGADGAFGAGLLVGWTEAGTRPEFELVTGTSTGAIIAPFAFLGPRYDPQLEEIYTTISTGQLVKPAILSGIFGGDALADTSGLEQLIARYTPPQVLEEIAAEYRKGRLLLIATTNLDAQRPVIWNIGAIADSGHPRGLELFRKIIRASAAIPGAFPPVSIDVTVNGERFNELHVDGGVAAQVFIYPPQISPANIDRLLGFTPSRKLYVIRNSKVTPEYSPTEAGVLAISRRSIDTLIKNQGLGDLYRIYALAERDRIDFRLAFIPADFAATSDELFDPKYMRNLFDLSRDLARKGYPWLTSPEQISATTAVRRRQSRP